MEDEIYSDAASDQQSVKGLAFALKDRFEKNNLNKSPLGLKPVTANKPKPQPKYGGGGHLNVCAPGATKDSNETSKSNSKTDDSVVKREKSDSAPMNGLSKKRDSKVNIPAAFQGSATPADSIPMKPKPLGTKPAVQPKWKTNDSNNNASNTDTNTSNKPSAFGVKKVESGIQSPGNISPRGVQQTTKSNGTEKNENNPPSSGNKVLDMKNLLAGKVPMDLKSGLKPVTQKNTTVSNSYSPKPIVPSAAKKSSVGFASKTSNANNENVELRNNKFSKFGPRVVSKRKSRKTVMRKNDGKRFYQADEASYKECGDAPSKPDSLDIEIDFDCLEEDFKTAVKKLGAGNQQGQDWTDEFEDGEMYDDCGNIQRPASEIEPMTEEEESKWTGAGFHGLPSDDNDLPPPPPQDDWPQEEYDDVAVAAAQADDPDEIYEPIDEDNMPPPPPGPKSAVPPPTPPPTPGPKSHMPEPPVPSTGPKPAVAAPTTEESANKAKDSKDSVSEKERKKKEKEEKKQKEKELKQKQKELSQLKKNYKIDSEGLMQSVAKGTVKESNKGGKLDVAVTEGDRVDIIRMVNNPAGKWLVRIDTSQKGTGSDHTPYSPLELIGYVEASNIEVDTDIIRDVMEGSVPGLGPASPKTPRPSVSDEPQEVYEDVDGDNPEAEGLIEEDIYEECQ